MFKLVLQVSLICMLVGICWLECATLRFRKTTGVVYEPKLRLSKRVCQKQLRSSQEVPVRKDERVVSHPCTPPPGLGAFFAKVWSKSGYLRGGAKNVKVLGTRTSDAVRFDGSGSTSDL